MSDRIIADPDEKMMILGSIDERTKTLVDRFDAIEDKFSKSIHDLRDIVNSLSVTVALLKSSTADLTTANQSTAVKLLDLERRLGKVEESSGKSEVRWKTIFDLFYKVGSGLVLSYLGYRWLNIPVTP